MFQINLKKSPNYRVSLNMVTCGCQGINQTSTVQRYRIYQLTKYVRHMFTIESTRGNLLIQMQLILACKIHIFVHFFVLESFPHSCMGLLGFKMYEWKMKSCDFYEVSLLWKVATFMKSCDFYKKLWLLWKVLIFS